MAPRPRASGADTDASMSDAPDYHRGDEMVRLKRRPKSRTDIV